MAQQVQQQEDPIKAAKRFVAIKRSRDSLIDFMRFRMPHPEDMDDPSRSMYEVTPQAKLLCEILEKVERGELLRVCVSIGPQLGKSEIISRGFPAWFMGRNPYKHFMLGTYSQDFAEDFGGEVRETMSTPQYRQVFPQMGFRKGSKAKDTMITTRGGRMNFLGRGGAGSGKPADMMVIDDPIKDDKEAQSPTIRKDLWAWFNKVMMARCKTGTAIVIVHCLAGDTEVLMADGTSKPIRDVRREDSVATYEHGQVSAARVLNWANQGQDRIFKIKMQSGVIVKANGRHPFLVVGDEGDVWLRTDMLRKGNVIRKVITASGKASPVAQANAINQRNAGVYAHLTTTKLDGLLEKGRPLQKILQSAVERIFEIATGLIYRVTNACWPSRAAFARYASDTHRKPICQRSGKEGCASIIATTAALSGACCATTAISQSGMREQKKFYSQPQNTFEVTTDVIVDIVDGGTEDVFDIQVERTENFIANGLVSHNTRWHQDDLIGRLCDKEHPEHNPEIAKDWMYINIPAVVKDKSLAEALGFRLEIQTDQSIIEQFGDKPMASLWPERKSLKFLAAARRLDKTGFEALYMGNPTPEDGDFFKREWLKGYTPDELPKNLRKYSASDHAVSEAQSADPSCFGTAGVDEYGVIWIMPDLYWEKEDDTNIVVEEMLGIMQRQRPQVWWAERGHISKSILPFLRKRQLEEKVYTLVDDSMIPSVDKKTRARSIQGMFSLGRIRVPKFAPWWAAAEAELLRFPNGAHDDFVDMISWIGIGLLREIPATKERPPENVIRVGTIAWVKAAANREKRQAELIKKSGGM